jgi:dienelactone hydrolase
MTELWTPPKPDFEPRRVLIKKHVFTDESRDGRRVPIKLYYPECKEGESYPVIIWSHGLGGSVDGASFLSRYLASHGYGILHVQHHGTDSSLWEGKPGHPWDVIRATPIPRSASLNRFADVPYVLDEIQGWLAQHPEIASCLDFNRLGMSGHSFGALTTQVMAGQMFPDEGGALLQMKEPRFKAGILYSPVPIPHLSDEDPAKLYGPISIPLLHMTGTEDSSPIEDWGYEARLVIGEHAGDEEQYVHVLPEGDHMIYNGSRGKLGNNPNRDAHEDEIKQTALAFWDAYLKDEAGAKEWLTKTLKEPY